MSGQHPMIKATNVQKFYGSFHALKNVSGEVEVGKVVVICGASGSGKSTFIRTINGLEAITSGQILVQGEDVHSKSTNLNLLRRRVGFVFQQFNLFPHLTALDNVALGLRRLLGRSKKQANERASQLLSRVGLAHRGNYFPADLSGGEQQRVAIARALAMEPPIMLFDEPTSALDAEMVGEVLRVIRSLVDDGLTMVCVTHEMGFAREVADEIWFMEAGAIVERSSPRTFFSQPQHPAARRFVASSLRSNEISDTNALHHQ